MLPANVLPADGFRVRRFVGAVAAFIAVAGAFIGLLFPGSPAWAEVASGGCEDGVVTILPAPIAPWKGAPLRVLVVSEKPFQGELSLIAPDGSVAAKSGDRRGGPPYFWVAEVAAPAAGKWHATLAAADAPPGCAAITREIAVSAQKPAGPHGTPATVWPIRNDWDRATENLFSAWIEKLFDAPLDTEPSWKTWSDVLRDRSRNILFDYLGLNEDRLAMSVRPDCADFVYFLRAYFAFKMGLPFGYSNCSRGAGNAPPKCYQWYDIAHPEVTRPSPPPEQHVASAQVQPAPPPSNPGLFTFFSDAPVNAVVRPVTPPPPPRPKRLAYPASFGQYLRDVGDVVHTGSVRVSASEDNNDFYSVPLTQAALRPGTVYADPYGHVLMLVRLVREANGTPGVFLAVDAEPDGTVTRKRFWRGNFLFVHDPSLGSPGFKRFRPIVRDKGNALRRLSNAEIAKNPQYGNFSLEQSQFGIDDFYDRMDEVMSPEPLDPLRAMASAITSLEEQVQTRVTAVENGRKYQISHGEASMPDGPSIFQTTGAWEDFSTPARDFRLLIAIDVVRGYPDRVARHPDRFAIPAGKSIADVTAELQKLLASELAARKFSYTRSDGSAWTLTLKDVVDRMADLEMAYNPNDCVELRWAAPAQSDEAATCKRHASSAQRAKMGGYRNWFRERHWPTRA